MRLWQTNIRCTFVLCTLMVGLFSLTYSRHCAADKPTGVLKGVDGSFALSPDGGTLASTDGDGELIFWDFVKMTKRLVVPPKRTKDDPNPKFGIYGFSPDGKRLLTGSSYEVQLREVATGRTIRKWSVEITEPLRNWHISEPINTVDFHPAGRMFACGGGGCAVPGEIFLVDTVTRKDPVIFAKQDNEIRLVRFSRDGATLASGGTGDDVVLWSVARRKPERVLKQASPIADIAWAPKGDRLAVVGKDIRVWDLSPGKKPSSRIITPSELGVPKGMEILDPPQVAFLGNRSQLVVMVANCLYPQRITNRTAPGFLRIFDVDRRTTRNLAELPYKLECITACMAVSQDGKVIAVGVEQDILAWRLEAGTGN